MMDFIKRNRDTLVTIVAIILFALFWITRSTDVNNILKAIGLQASGFGILAAMYYIEHGHWNGYSDWTKIKVVVSLFTVLAILLVTVPESADLLSNFGITLDATGEGRLGFILLGLALSKMVQQKLDRIVQRSLNTEQQENIIS